MKFIYYLAAIGDSGLDKKLDILSKNLNHIYKNINCKFDIVINCYNSFDIIKNFIAQFDFIGIKYIYNKKGVLTELFLTNPHNASLSNYDYILFMLDDVEIQDMNLNNMINIKEKCGIEILSPKVINSSHPFMNAYDSNTLTINNALEVYCLLMKHKDFLRFISIHTIENKWMWGADFLFGFFNIKAGVYNRASVKHMLLPSKKYIDNAYKLMNVYLKKINFNGNINDITPVKKVINLRTGTSKTTSNENGSGQALNTKNMNIVDRSKTISNMSTLSKVNKPIIVNNSNAVNKPIIVNNSNTVNKPITANNSNTANKLSSMVGIGINKPTKSTTLSVTNKSTTLSNINKMSNVTKPNTISNINKMSNVTKPNMMSNVNKLNTMSNLNKPNRASTVSTHTSNKNTKFTLSNIVNR